MYLYLYRHKYIPVEICDWCPNCSFFISIDDIPSRMWSVATNVAIGPPSRMMPWSVRTAAGSGARTVLNLRPPSFLFLVANVRVFPSLIAMNASQKERPCTVSARVLIRGIPAVVSTATIAKSVMPPCAKAVGLIMTVQTRMMRTRMRTVMKVMTSDLEHPSIMWIRSFSGLNEANLPEWTIPFGDLWPWNCGRKLFGQLLLHVTTLPVLGCLV